MSLTKDLLIILTNYNDGYRIMRMRMLGREGYPKDMVIREEEELKETTIRTTLYRLRKNGLANHEEGIWFITKSGKKYLEKLLGKKKYVYKQKPDQKSVKNMIIAFDIPEKLKFKRELTRDAIKNLNFTMLQKSVWFGPAPLPEEFIKWLRELEVFQYMKFFKAAEHDIA